MKKQYSLKWKILKYLISSIIFVLVSLIMFQSILLPYLYEQIKKYDLINISKNIEKSIDDVNIYKYIQAKNNERDACILVLSENERYTSNSNGGCELYKLSTTTFLSYVDEAYKNNNELLFKLKIPSYDIKQNNDSKIILKTKGIDSLFYFKIINHNNQNYIIVVNNNITPINTTSRILTLEIIFLFIIVLISLIILNVILSKKIVTPIEKINVQAKNLSYGKYNSITNIKIKEFKELNDTLVNAAVDINKADILKKQLVANVSHDIKTPLTMISGYGEMMIDFPEEKTDENIKIIVDESKKLTDFVNDLLDLSKLQENKIDLNISTFNIYDLIIETVNKYKSFNSRNIIINNNENIFVKADKNKIKQVINNFILNALNYSKDDVIISYEIINNYVKVKIKDFGIGIDKSDLVNIWDRYYKVDKEHNRMTNGLGLAIIKEILQKHGYDYGVDSEVNKGSEFYFMLPIQK